jgi:transposase
MAYSRDYRERTIEYYHEGHTQAEVYEAFKVYPSTIRDWEARINDGTIEPRYPESRKPRKLPLNELSRYVNENPDAVLREIGEHFQCSAEAVRKALKKLDITVKKKQ